MEEYYDNQEGSSSTNYPTSTDANYEGLTTGSPTENSESVFPNNPQQQPLNESSLGSGQFNPLVDGNNISNPFPQNLNPNTESSYNHSLTGGEESSIVSQGEVIDMAPNTSLEIGSSKQDDLSVSSSASSTYNIASSPQMDSQTDGLDSSQKDIDNLREKADGVERGKHEQPFTGRRICPTRHGCTGATDCDACLGAPV